MRNKLEFTLDPEDLFLDPWREEGVSLVSEPDFIWREHPAATIEGFAVSAHDAINRKIHSFTEVTRKQKKFGKALWFNAAPVVVRDVEFRKSQILSSGRFILKGAAGTRAINGFRFESEATEGEPEEALNAYFAQCREKNAGRALPVATPSPDAPIAIECRNTFNYYHFITESLAQLALFDGLTEGRDIFFHYPNEDDKQRDFVRDFVEALFPETTGRVFFERSPKSYPEALTGFEMISAQLQAPADSALDSLIPRHIRNRLGGMSVEMQPLLQMNAVSESLLALRDRALRAIEGQDFSHLPTRFFIGRRDDHARARPMARQERLLEHLELFGFEEIAFEDYPPLEQIALMARAEIVIGAHGAGLTNMLFAHPDAQVIELGTLQTAQFRWADFWPLAHASQCRYISFFADFNTDDPLKEPHFATDGIVPVALSDAAIAQILSYVVSVLGHVPELPSARTVEALARRLLRAGLAEQALALLDRHEDVIKGDADFFLLRGDCHKALAEPKSELVAIDQAFKADPTRWQTLIRIIWCAHHCDRPQVIRWALSRLERDFPERHAAFVGNHDWVRFVA
ncbi:glycosyltransferase family 61 protein [Sulfitobacter sp. HNIBRBA3233]|uniref:glycosyltransferase family 61 protein n=1 Tax=Sulfitobacter marinivivus TaxID=3158558 RepID=UPI0032DFE237